MRLLLNPRLWLVVACAAFWAFTHWVAYRQGGASAWAELAGYKLQAADQAELQRLSNRGRSQAAERSEGDRIVYRERVITKTITEVRHATAPLADCPVPASAVRVLNDAARCARQGGASACAADDAVRDPG